MSSRQVERSSGEQGEAVPQPRQHCRGREDRAPCRGQLDRQRQAVQAAADLPNDPKLLASGRKVRLDPVCPLDEQPDRGVLGQIDARSLDVEVGHRERWHGEDLLPADVERAPTGYQNPQPRTSAEQVAHRRGRGDDLLEVVEQQEDGLVLEVGRERLGERTSANRREAQPLAHRGEDEVGIREWSEGDEEHSVGEHWTGLTRNLHRETGFAGARWAGQRQQSRCRQESR